ncbi:MAG TPA: hypothetical protein VM327_09835 [Candidatus Thermoplasmatota archaeon]|nr:hypothetical protein [Candidatus Thermoplasmatota archaeon]
MRPLLPDGFEPVPFAGYGESSATLYVMGAHVDAALIPASVGAASFGFLFAVVTVPERYQTEGANGYVVSLHAVTDEARLAAAFSAGGLDMGSGSVDVERAGTGILTGTFDSDVQGVQLEVAGEALANPRARPQEFPARVFGVRDGVVTGIYDIEVAEHTAISSEMRLSLAAEGPLGALETLATPGTGVFADAPSLSFTPVPLPDGGT